MPADHLGRRIAGGVAGVVHGPPDRLETGLADRVQVGSDLVEPGLRDVPLVLLDLHHVPHDRDRVRAVPQRLQLGEPDGRVRATDHTVGHVVAARGAVLEEPPRSGLGNTPVVSAV
jgi:hypothetical protein